VNQSIQVYGAKRQLFLDDFNYWAAIVMGTSLLAVLSWYVLGEWGLRAQRTSSGSWMIIWFVLLTLVIISAFAAQFMGPKPSPESGNGDLLTLFFFGGGAFFYWLATVCFSPIAIKTVPPLAKYIRRW